MNQRDLTYAKWVAVAGGVLLVVAAALEYWPASSTLQWMNIAEARKQAVKENKPVLVDFYAEWCGPCKQMEKSVFPDDSVRSILETRFVLAKINGDDPIDGDTLRKQFGIRAYPTYILLSPSGRERRRYVGFIPKSNFIMWLKDSTGIQIMMWPETKDAVAKAMLERKRVMVLVLQSHEDIEDVNTLFEEPKVVQAIGKHFSATLLIRGNVGEDALLSNIAATPKTGMSEVIVLETNGKEVGRFFLTPEMEYNNFALAEKLIGLAGK